MQKLSLRKQLVVVRLYLGGLSYDEIAAKADVSKGTVANIVSELKAGRFPEASNVSEQLELLRELAIDLRRYKLTPGRAAAGVAVLSHLQEFGLEPTDIERWAALCHTLTPDTETQAFARVALALEEVRKRTGLSVDALEKKVHNLEQAAGDLEPLAQQVLEHREQLKELTKQRQRLVDELAELEKRLQSLSPKVKDNEKRETELFHRVQELEQRAQAADERLTTTRKDLRVLAELGLPPNDLSGFTQRLCGIAQRHGIDPGVLCEWLLHELEQLEKGLSLEILVRKEQQELGKTKQSQDKAQEELAALKAAIQELRQEQASLRSIITEERKHISKEAQAIVLLAKDTITKLKQSLGDGVDEALLEIERLRHQALELGKELGHFEAVVQSNKWLQELLALIKGDDNVSSGQVRVIGLVVLRSMSAWLNQHSGDIGSSQLLRAKISAAVEELERWKV